MRKSELEYILDIANECKNHSENSISSTITEFASLTFILQAFHCVKKLEEINLEVKSETLKYFCKHFYHFNEAVIAKTGLEKNDFKILDDTYYKLKSEIIERLNTKTFSFE